MDQILQIHCDSVQCFSERANHPQIHFFVINYINGCLIVLSTWPGHCFDLLVHIWQNLNLLLKTLCDALFRLKYFWKISWHLRMCDVNHMVCVFFANLLQTMKYTCCRCICWGRVLDIQPITISYHSMVNLGQRGWIIMVLIWQMKDIIRGQFRVVWE